MLSELTIHNFGLIDNLSIEFDTNLNIFTGETGAGKSIIIDALRYALGEKLLKSHIKNHDKPCTVEAVFDLTGSRLLENNTIKDIIDKDEPLLIIKRSETSGKRKKNKINGETVTLSLLKKIGTLLLDFHGPHDHQQILSTKSHIEIIDRLSANDQMIRSYQHKYSDYKHLKNEIVKLEEAKTSRDKELDMLGYQIKEFEQVPLDRENYENYMQMQARQDNIDTLNNGINQLLSIFEENEYSIDELLRKSFTVAEEICNIDKSNSELTENLYHMQEYSERVIYHIKNMADELSDNSHYTADLNTICDTYHTLLKKHGPEIEDVHNHYIKIKEQFDMLNNIDENTRELQKKHDSLKRNLNSIALSISTGRDKTAQKLEKIIKKELSELGMPSIKFKCIINRKELDKKGFDEIIFYITTNPGEPLKPLSEIVSSGEAARVMLALKKALMNVDPVPVLIFDEIDAQIGGRLGKITGKKLKQLSHNRQVILITHLPQIASFANTHFHVSKKVSNNSTQVVVKKLEGDSKTKELAKMMSGEKESKISIVHAEELLSKAK